VWKNRLTEAGFGIGEDGTAPKQKSSDGQILTGKV